MPYSETVTVFTSFMTNINLQINVANNDESIATLTYTKYDGSYNVLETKDIILKGAEMRAIIPELASSLKTLADTYNAFNPARKIPLSETIE